MVGTVLLSGDDDGPPDEPAVADVLETIRWSASAGASPGYPVGGDIAIAGDVIALGGTSSLYGLDASTGVVRWTRPLGEDTWNQALADGDVVLTQSAGWVGGDHHRVEALDAPTGRLLWSVERPGWSGSLTVHGGVGFLSMHEDETGGTIAALDVRSGSTLWERPDALHVVANDDGVVLAVEWASSEDEEPAEDNRPPTTIWDLHALEATTGETRWTVRLREDPEWMASTDARVVGDAVVVAEPDGGLRAHDLATGELRWRRDAVRRDHAFLATADGVAVATPDRRLALIDAASGEERWRTERGVLTDRHPVLIGDAVITRSGGALTAFGLEDGAMLWQLRGVPGSALGVVGGLVIGTEAGRRIAAVDATTGTRTWELDLPTGALADIAAGESGVHRTNNDVGRLVTYDLDDGSRLWQQRLAGWMSTSPLPVGDLVVVRYVRHEETADGQELVVETVAFDAVDGERRWSEQGTSLTSSPGVRPGASSLPRPAASAEAGTLVAAHGRLIRGLSLSDGRERWRRELGAVVVHDPAVASTTAVVTAGGDLIGVDVTTGEITAEVALGAEAVGTAALTRAGTAFVITEDATVVAVDLREQRIVWRIEIGAVSAHTPTVVGATVVITTGQRIAALDAASGRELWHHSAGGPLIGAPVAGQGGLHLATTSGDVLALDPATGEVHSVFIAPRGLSAGPVAVGELTYVVDVSGAIVAIGPRAASLPTPRAPEIRRH